MGIRDAMIQEEKKNFIIVVKTRKWADIGYWIRDLKKKLNKAKILDIKITLSIDYFENEIY